MYWSAVAAAALTTPPAIADDFTRGALDPRGGLVVTESTLAPGQTEGTYVATGYGVDGLIDLARGRHAFVGRLHVLEALGATIVTPDAVKAADDVNLSARYGFALLPWLSLHLSALADFPLFGSRTAPAEQQPFIVRHVDQSEELGFGKSIQLTHPLLPLSIRERMGIEARVLEFPFIRLSALGALGGQHEIADGQLRLLIDPRPRVVTAVELETYHAIGPVLGLSLDGHVSTRFAYSADLDIRFPLAHTATHAGSGLPLGELTEVDTNHSVRLELLPWLTVDYDLSVGYRPLLLKGVRIENRLMLAARPRALP